MKKMDVWNHLYLKWFMPGYKIWYLYEERLDYSSISEHHTADCLDEPSTDVKFGVNTVQMVNNAYRESLLLVVEDGDRQEARRTQFRRYVGFYMIDENNPIYKLGYFNFFFFLILYFFISFILLFLSRVHLGFTIDREDKNCFPPLP